GDPIPLELLRLRVLPGSAGARAQPVRHAVGDPPRLEAGRRADRLRPQSISLQRDHLAPVPDSGPSGPPLRLDAAADDPSRRAERLPAGADRRHLPASADPDGRYAGTFDRVPVRQDLNVACLTHAYPRWDGDVAGGFIERLVLALRARGHSVHVVAPADEGVGGTELRHQVPVTGVRYAPARWETLAYRGTLAAGVRSPAGLLWAAAGGSSLSAGSRRRNGSTCCSRRSSSSVPVAGR